MADAPPLPKLKPGSLRDRIAAFEKPAAATTSSPNRPPVRPKPGNVSWKPMPPSPPAAALSTPEDEEAKRGGMSASDAKESIGRAGTLKERMAALQGRGAFGGALPAGPPPVGPKPMKRPPLVVSHSVEEEEGDENQKPRVGEDLEVAERTVGHVGEVGTALTKEGETPAEEEDEEVKERERRAAIAARMARLGGARVGMAPPPTLGKKPIMKRKDIAEQVEKPSEGPKESSLPELQTGDENLAPELAQGELNVGDDSTPRAAEHAASSEAKEGRDIEISQKFDDEESHSKASVASALEPSLSTASPSPEPRPTLDSSDTQSSVTLHYSPPRSMPVPPVPRRAGPPRKRSARNIRVQAAKEQEAAGEAFAAPSPNELMVTPTLATEDIVLATEENMQGDGDQLKVLEHANAEGDINPDPVNDHIVSTDAEVTPSSDQPIHNDEMVHEAPQSDHQTVDDERDPDSFDPAFKSMPEADELHIPDVDVQDDPVVEQAWSLHAETTKNLPSGELPTSVVPSVLEEHEEALYDQVTPMSHDECVDDVVPEETPPPSTMVEYSPSLPVVPDPPTFDPVQSLVDTTAQVGSELSLTTTAEDETEDETTARRKRIAERLAKMGGQNPFMANPFGSAAPPSRKASADKPIIPESVLAHEAPSSSEQVAGNDDISREREAIAETVVASDGHEAEDLPQRDFDVTEQDEDVPSVELPLEEHEEREPENETSEIQTPLSALVSLSDESPLNEETAPPRVTRSIPPPPLSAQVGIHTVSPTPTHLKRASVRRTLPPLPRHVAVPLEANVSSAPCVEEESSPKQETITSDYDDTSLSASVPMLSPPENEQTEAEGSVCAPPTVSIPPRPPIVTSLVESRHTQSPSSAASEHSQISISPSVSPTSSRRASLLPARRLPPPLPNPISPQADSVTSASASMKKSVSPPSVTPLDINGAISRTSVGPSITSSTEPIPGANRDSIEEQEVLEDSEPDPIDPSFYSPQRSPVVPSPRNQQFFAYSSKEAPSADATEDDNEQTRRQTIAERMAKLGGIRFGAPPPIHRAAPSITPGKEEVPKEDPDETVEALNDVSEEPQEQESEEAARVRRQAISARLAGMGGLRFGMVPQTPPVHPRTKSDDSVHTLEAPSPTDPLRRPSAPESTASDADLESEEGIKVEAGSELSMEEVTAEDATEEPEEIPPPIPSRPDRRSFRVEVPPPLPAGRRPPIPMPALSNRPTMSPTETKPSGVSGLSREPSGRNSVPAPDSTDFVVINNTEEHEIPPLPPPRPPRSIPPPSRPVVPQAPAKRDAQWELPDIPTGSFDLNVGAGLGLDASFSSEDSTTYPSAPSSSSPSRTTHVEPKIPSTTQAAPQSEVQLSADELLQLWGAVGTVVHSVASSLFEKSKKTLIGDGTSRGFVAAVLAQVPQASAASYGHLVYSQSAHAVLRRSSNIMPGDIILLTEAKLKGHKGLQSYTQTVGTVQDPHVAIVSEFDPKKSKVKVYQANQHVGAQSVETASYRLEDLKSGNVRVFRVASIQ